MHIKRDIIMENIAKKALLYDFYGALLTPHQKSIYEDAVNCDMSLSEIAEEYQITRQGVHDLVKRCDKILEDYENKLHLVEHFLSVRTKAETIRNEARLCVEISDNLEMSDSQMILHLRRMEALSEEMIDEL